jgi:dimethylhistidine N-methyltransferase
MSNLASDRREIDYVGRLSPASAEFAEAMLLALRGPLRQIDPKFFYDEAGSALFERICELDEYYLTRTERAILSEHAPRIAQLVGPSAEIVEFGAGGDSKIRILLGQLASPTRYVPVDLSATPWPTGPDGLGRDYPDLEVAPLAADFTRPLALPARRPNGGRRVGLFLGSTIGNLSPEDVHGFLTRAASQFQGGGLLVGVDLVKDPAVLHRAYNDAQGTTAQFNRNLLVRANRELGADFDLPDFHHYAFYQPHAQCIEMHLVSARRQTVRVCGQPFVVEEGETLHTENSRKYTIDGFRALARRAGLAPGPVWCDPKQWYSVHWLASPPRPTRASGDAR